MRAETLIFFSFICQTFTEYFFLHYNVLKTLRDTKMTKTGSFFSESIQFNILTNYNAIYVREENITIVSINASLLLTPSQVSICVYLSLVSLSFFLSIAPTLSSSLPLTLALFLKSYLLTYLFLYHGFCVNKVNFGLNKSCSP